VDGETLIFSAKLSGVHINWDCSGGTLPAKYRPSKCRAGRLSSQQSNDSTRLVKDPDEQYTFRIPRNWSSRTDLNDEASFQFANLVREEYVLVFQEQKIELPQYTLEDYATVLTDNFALSELSNEYKGESNISGLRVLNYELKGTIEGIKLNYQVGFIEGKEHYYYLLFWTIEDKKSSAFPVFNNTLHSFREL
ncbi:MAG: pilin, partial [Kangiellaceae bacterium]|nr:pilin [Kangiellaceae bacterium]